jgi:capsular polysaccharide biosynthesis protein
MALEEAARDPTRPVTYTEFAGASRSPPQPPAFLFGPFPAYLAPDLFLQFDVPAVGCYRLREAQVSYDAVILLQGQPVWSLALNHPDYYVPEALAANVPDLYSLKVRHIPGQAAIIHGPGYNIFGHWLADFLPRLYVLRRAGLDIGALKIILPRQIDGFVLEFLRLIGIPTENLVRHDHKAELLQPDELVVPTVMRLRNRFNPLLGAASRFWIERVLAADGRTPSPARGRRLFVSRGQNQHSRTIASRERIEARAADAGYDIVYPERLGLAEQIALFRSAGRIIGEYGSGLHGAIHAPAGAVICALRGTSHHPGFIQSGLAETFGHHLGYVLGQTERFAQDQLVTIEDDAFGQALAAMEVWGEGKKNVLF